MPAPPLDTASGPRRRALRRIALLAALALPPSGAAAQEPPAPAPDQPAPGGAARAPQDPLELWYQIDYLVRVGKPEQAAPHLDRFLKSGPDDPTLLAIRDRYGVGSILRLEDYPQTRAQARTLLDLLSAASRRNAQQVERICRFVDLLTASPE